MGGRGVEKGGANEMSNSRSLVCIDRRSLIMGAVATAAAASMEEAMAVEDPTVIAQTSARSLADAMRIIHGGEWGFKMESDFVLVFKKLSGTG